MAEHIVIHHDVGAARPVALATFIPYWVKIPNRVSGVLVRRFNKCWLVSDAMVHTCPTHAASSRLNATMCLPADHRVPSS